MRVGNSWRRGYGSVLLATSFTAAAADWFFYGHPVGWTAGLFAALLLVMIALRGVRFLGSPPGKLVAVGLLGLIVLLVEQPTPLAIILTILALAIIAMLNRAEWRGGTTYWAGRTLELASLGLFRWLLDSRLAARWLRRHPASSAGPARGASLWALPVVLSAVFVGMFALANPLVGLWVGRAWEFATGWMGTWERLPNTERLAFWIVTAAAVYALLRARVRRGRSARARQPVPPPLPGETAAARLGRGIVVRCLLAFNVVFAAQNGMDLLYLVGGATLPEGMTYAQYAHRGAYPLVATALLAALFVLVAFRPGGVAERSSLARRLVYLWLAQNVLLTCSAAWRLDLYVDVYSLTHWRLAAAVWMVLVATGLVWVIVRIALRRDNAWLLDRNALTAAFVLFACCFVNTNGLIADFNARHCAEAGGAGPPIDLRYLRLLGPDALPAVRRMTPLIVDPVRREAAVRIADALRADLDSKLADWRGWTFRRSRLAR